MDLPIVDVIVFVVFVISVVTIGILMSRQEKDSESYFLAGRSLKWWLIGFSLIAANISTEQFVGMSGNAASHVGLAIASYEWMAAITLVVVAFAFLPYFLRVGIFTMPEFLEVRFNAGARTIMAVATLFIYMLLLGSVTYSGALTIQVLFAKWGTLVPLWVGSLIIGLIAMLYVATGGLKACAWADLIQGSALVIGGAIIMVLAFVMLGTVESASTVVNVATGETAVKTLAADQGAIARFWELNSNRMNMFLPATDSILPWTALMLGLWIPNFYYWGLNQYITQRTLGSASLAEGQRGIVFAAFLKLVIPFVVVVPGIIAFNLFAPDMQLAARADVAPVLAAYVKGNPESQQVVVAEEPDAAAVAALPAGKLMLALYPSAEAMRQAAERPDVLPLLKSDFDAIEKPGFTVFSGAEDHAWKHVYPALAVEIAAYNARVEVAATVAAEATTTEKLIAYKYDSALGHLMGEVLPRGIGVLGFVLAALLGAVVSSLAAMLNAASTIFSMDVYKKYIAPEASQKALVTLGRVCVVVFTAIAVFLAPQLGNPAISNSIFTVIQEGQGFISPGILAVFVIGLAVRRAPYMCGVVGLVTNIVAYGALKLAVPEIQFLNRMAICFALCIGVMLAMRVMRPLEKPVVFEAKTTIQLHSSRGALIAGVVCVVLTLALYVVFSPLALAPYDYRTTTGPGCRFPRPTPTPSRAAPTSRPASSSAPCAASRTSPA